jgi:hypothetical protein
MTEEKMSREQVEKLKADWFNDPCWDLVNTVGFEEHKEELEHFQKYWEDIWKKEIEEEKRQANEMAEKLGVVGLYRLIKKQEEALTKHERVIELILEGKTLEGWRVFNGHFD